jgi:SAM-dependent methyltransferase
MISLTGIHAVGRCLVDQSKPDWFEDESFWERMFPFIFSEASFVEAAANVPKITALAEISAGSLLDLACGPGRYAIPFAQAGFNVTAVDRSGFLLDQARDRATRTNAPVEWVEQDMRQFVRPAAFDLAINLFTSFGYFEDPAENRRVLENLFAGLKPGGTFVFDHLGKEVLAARFQPTRSELLPNGTVLFHRTSIVDDWSRIDDEWILLEGNRASKFRIRHWLYSAREILDLFASVGFASVQLHGDLEGTSYGPQAERLIAVARKPPR